MPSLEYELRVLEDRGSFGVQKSFTWLAKQYDGALTVADIKRAVARDTGSSLDNVCVVGRGFGGLKDHSCLPTKPNLQQSFIARAKETSCKCSTCRLALKPHSLYDNLFVTSDGRVYILSDHSCTSLWDTDPLEPEAVCSSITGEPIKILVNKQTSQDCSLQVRTLFGKVIDLKAVRSSTVQNIKEMIQEREGIPPDQHRLIWQGTQLYDSRTLMEYGVPAGTIQMVLVLRLRGGMFHETSGRSDNDELHPPPNMHHVRVLLPDGRGGEVLEVPVECTAAQLVEKLRAKGSLRAVAGRSSGRPAVATAAADSGDDHHDGQRGAAAGRVSKRACHGTRSWADVARA